MTKYLKLMRVHHYMKNLLVFAALLCSGQLLNIQKLITCLIGFMAFCMISSVVYIVNDIQDIEKDRNHPTKCKRPLASGAISVRSAYILLFLLLVISIALNILIYQPLSSILLLLYLILNLCYSFGLKDYPIIDISILVSGFLIRIIYGAVITNITISNWLYLTVIALSFYFSLGKRRNEMKNIQTGTTRTVLFFYTTEFLDKNMIMFLSLANMFYALWSMDENTISLYNTDRLIFSVPIILLITMKYSLDIEGESDGDPVEVLIHDKILLCMCVLYLLVMFWILYLHF